MALEKYANIRFTPESIERLDHVAEVISHYASKGYDLTVRQLFYRLVAKNQIKNDLKSYKGFVGLVTDGRMAGKIDWDIIVDRNRRASRPQSWETIPEFLQDIKWDFQLDKWKTQPVHVEVMVEKDALAGVLGPVCSKWDVTFSPNKGYSSATMMRRTGKRMRSYIDQGKKCVLLYLGDHDPSGIDMTRDVRERLHLLGGDPMDPDDKHSHPFPLDESELEIVRIALNEDQIKQYNPPENPVKTHDARSPGYVARFGDRSWELDSLDPEVLDKLVTDQITSRIDFDLWDKEVAREQDMIKDLSKRIEKMYPSKKTKKHK